jgi:putative ABC transport system permease protein
MSDAGAGLGWAAAWRIARRDLHRRFRGLRLLLVCLFLGVGALAAIGSLTSAIRGELDAQGQTLLGGDLEVEVWQRPLTEEETAYLENLGTVSQGLRMQAMASAGEAAAPIELKAVDSNWPLFGSLVLEPHGCSAAGSGLHCAGSRGPARHRARRELPARNARGDGRRHHRR